MTDTKPYIVTEAFTDGDGVIHEEKATINLTKDQAETLKGKVQIVAPNIEKEPPPKEKPWAGNHKVGVKNK